MDSQTIKDGAQANGANPKTVTLAGQEIVFNKLKDNFADITNPAGAPNGNIKTLDININKSGKEIELSKSSGTLKGIDEKGNKFDITKNSQPADNITKIKDLLKDTDWSTATKLGEGDFALRLTVEDNKQDIKVELVDKSNFNGGKEYVMDSQTIKDATNGNDPKTVTLAGQEIVFKDLAGNFVNNPAGNNIKTLDINIKNEVTKEEDEVKVYIIRKNI